MARESDPVSSKRGTQMLRSIRYACTLTALLIAPQIATAQQTDASAYGSSVVPVSAAMPVSSMPSAPVASGGPVPAYPGGTRAFGRSWGSLSPQDWERFYHYPYVYYPQNFWGNGYYRSSDSLYYRYPSEMRIPVYNKKWHNYYPSPRPYHKGHHFVLDVF